MMTMHAKPYRHRPPSTTKTTYHASQKGQRSQEAGGQEGKRSWLRQGGWGWEVGVWSLRVNYPGRTLCV